MNPLVSFNRILGWVYLGIGVLVLIGWAVSRATIVLRAGGILVPLGALHLAAAHGFARERRWRWLAQAAPFLLLLTQLIVMTAR